MVNILEENGSILCENKNYVLYLSVKSRPCVLAVEPDDLKKLGSALNALCNEKSKQLKVSYRKSVSVVKWRFNVVAVVSKRTVVSKHTRVYVL